MKKFLSLCLVIVLLLSINPAHVSAAVKLNKNKITLDIGEQFNLKATGVTNKVKWSTSNKKVVSVTSKGKIEGVSEGSATITATVNNKQYKCKVTVSDTVNVTFTEYFSTIDEEFIETTKEENKNFIDVIKYDNTHYTVKMLESDRKKEVKEINEELEALFNEFINSEDYNNTFTDTKYDKLLTNVTLYVDPEKFNSDASNAIIIPLTFLVLSDYVQAYNLVEVDERLYHLEIVSNVDGEIIYQSED